MGITNVETAPRRDLLGNKNSNDPKMTKENSVAVIAVNDALMIIGASLAALLLLIWSLRHNNI